ncbi:unnamed protein product [Dovyalis caffra]|uniref:Uncharacterized protein n=1 Tax=Dovyalis caffra TaxID=77055 RepID=A0AAV1S018_9ROSI|nr:unnamed protein product [Dovyalis caffra]
MSWGMTPSINLCKFSYVSLPSESKEEMDEIAVVLKRFGDEQSTLLDQFERLSFEVQLNQAILGRSLSEPGASRSRLKAPVTGQAPAPLATQVKQGCRRRRRGYGFDKLLKKLLKPILGRKAKGGSGAAKKEGMEPNPQDPKSWKAFTDDGFRSVADGTTSDSS